MKSEFDLRDALSSVLFIFSALACTIGAWMIYRPAGFLVCSAFALAASILLAIPVRPAKGAQNGR